MDWWKFYDKNIKTIVIILIISLFVVFFFWPEDYRVICGDNVTTIELEEFREDWEDLCPKDTSSSYISGSSEPMLPGTYRATSDPINWNFSHTTTDDALD